MQVRRVQNMIEWEQLYPIFIDKILSRLKVGAQSYGDISFSYSPSLLGKNIEEEILDICGWSFVLWVRLQQLKKVLDKFPES